MNPLQDAFISYGRTDSKQFAKALNDRLVALGYTIWFDFEDIPLGVDYQKQIDDGIEKADNFLFIIAPHSVNSPYCRLEIEHALRCHKRIIPLLHVEQIDRETWQQRHPHGTDAQWADYQAAGKHSSFIHLHPEISKINWVYFREGLDDFEARLAGLLELLERHKPYVRQHTVLLDRALAWERNQKQTRYLLIGSDREQAQTWLATRFTESQPPCLPTDLHCEFITESIKNANNLMTQVFLCHADKDRDSAEQIRRSLLRQGMTVWNYRTDIQTSQDYHTAITQGIETADNVLFILSPAAAQSAYCQRELAQAEALHKRIIPVLAAPVSPEQVPASVRSLQQIDLTDNVAAHDYLADESQLLKILNTDAAYYTEHKTWLTQALKWQRQHQNPTMLLRGYNLRQAETWLKVARTHRHPPTALHEQFITESLRQPPDPSLDVFISYSRVDSDFARRLNETLQIQGKRTWFDQESIASGTDFQQEIYHGIASSDVFLFVLSPQAINSPYCADEVEYAYSLNKRIVTVLHRAIATEDLHPVLAKLQWLDFRDHGGDFQANFQHLLRTLDTDREHLEAHTRLLLRAAEWDRKGRDESLLLRGQALAAAATWLVTNGAIEPQPTGLQQEYVRASTARQAAQTAAEQKLRRGALVGAMAAIGGILVAVGSGWVAVTQQRAAEAARTDAIAAKAEAEAAIAEADQRTTAATQQAAQANAQTAAAQAQKAQAESAQATAEAAQQQAEAAAQTAQTRAREANAQAAQATAAQQQAQAAAQTATQQAAAAERASQIAATQQAAAEKATQIAEQGTRLEQAGIAALNRVDFDSVGAALSALSAGQDLLNLAEAEQYRTVSAYPAASPTLALQQIRQQVGNTQLLAHAAGVRSAVFSLDGTQIVTASEDGTAQVWNAITGAPIARLDDHQAVVYSAAFSPDGTQIVTVSSDGFIHTTRVWDATTGSQIASLEGHQDWVNSAVFSPDGQHIVTASSDGTARIWNAATGAQIALLEGHQNLVNSAVFSPDGTQIVTASDDGTARIWNATTGTPIARFDGHQNRVSSAAFSPDGQQVVTASADSSARVWDATTGAQIALLEGHQGVVNSAVFSPDGQHVVTAATDGGRLWDVTTGTQIARLGGHLSWVYSALFSPDGQQVVTASDDGTAQVWNIAEAQIAPLDSPDAEAYLVGFSPDGQQAVTTSDDGTARLWQTTTNTLIAPLDGHEGAVSNAVFSPDGQQVVTTSDNGTARVWNATTGTPIALLEGHVTGVYNAAFSPDGQQVITTSYDGTARVWNATTGTPIALLEGHQGVVNSAAFSSDGQQVVTAADDGTARVWNATTGAQIALLEGHQNWVNSAAFSSDGQQVVTAADDGTTRVWNATTGAPIALLEGHQGSVYGVAFSPDGQQVVTASADGTARLWHSQTGVQIALLEGHEARVYSAAFSPDGQQVITTSADRTTRLWDLRGRQLAIYEGELGVFSPDGRQVITVVGSRVQGYDVQTLPALIAWSCEWLHNYLVYGKATDTDRALCNLPPREAEAAAAAPQSSALSRALHWVRQVLPALG